MTGIEDDPRGLLPHFTPQLALELRNRLKRRICEEFDTFNDYRKVKDAGSPDELSFQIVARMFRTQLKEAKALISFTEATIAFNQASLEAAAPALPAKAQAKLKTFFRNPNHRQE